MPSSDNPRFYGHMTLPWPDRFWAKVEKADDGCWIFRGAATGRGYGVIQIAGRARPAHIVAWEMANGPVPEGLILRHRCDVRRCVNTAHMETGTHADNMRDMVERGRSASGDRNAMRAHPERRPRGDQHWARLHPERVTRGSSRASAVLTEQDIPAIRARWAAGERLPAIAADYGISTSAVSRIGKGLTWGHVPGQVGTRERHWREGRWV